MYTKPFDRVIDEYVDITHRETREYVMNLDESEQNTLLMKLTAKLYNHITARITDIDFGSIPNSKGDITKIENYQQMMDCLDVIKGILVEYHQKTEPVDILQESIENIKSRKDKFELAFKINAEFPVLIYSTVVLAIVSSVSFLITTCIEYIKVPNSDEFQITLNKVGLTKTKNNLLFDNLKRFNASCKKGEMDKVLEAINKGGAKFMLGIVDTYMVMNAVVLAGIALSIIPFIRELIYFFYYSRVKISDYFEIQAELLQMNIYNLEKNNDIPEEKKKDIIAKQSKIVNTFKSISNSIAISNKTAENKARKDIETDSKKITITNQDIDSDSTLF